MQTLSSKQVTRTVKLIRLKFFTRSNNKSSYPIYKEKRSSGRGELTIRSWEFTRIRSRLSCKDWGYTTLMMTLAQTVETTFTFTDKNPFKDCDSGV